jgi:hypothetical protein
MKTRNRPCISSSVLLRVANYFSRFGIFCSSLVRISNFGFRISLFIPILLLAGTASALPASTQLPDPLHLFNRHFAAIGGREALAVVDGAVVTGTVVEDGQTSDFTLLVRSPGMILLTLRDAKGKTTRQGRDPRAHFWQQDARGIRDLEELPAGELASMSRPFHLAGLVDMSTRLEDSVCETDVASGRAVLAIGHKANKGPRMFPRLLFDAETGLLVGCGRTRFADYAEISNASNL